MNCKSKEFLVVFSLIFITGIYINILRYTRVSVREQIELKQIPDHFGDWQLEESYFLDEKTLNILKSDQDVWRRYINSDDYSVDFLITYFKDQKYGAQIHSPLHCLPGGGWKIADRAVFELAIDSSSARRIKINKMINTKGQYRMLMLYWFWTRSGIIRSEYGLKFDLAKNALLRRPTDASFIRISLPYIENDLDKTLDVASQFVQDVFPIIKEILPFRNLY